MKQVKWLSRVGVLGTVIVSLAGTALLAQQGGNSQDRSKKKYVIEITPASAELEIGETVQFIAQAVDREGSAAEVEIEWSVLNKKVGEIDENGFFTALEGGHTNVVARAEQSVGRAEVIVRRDTSNQGQGSNRLKVVIRPGSAVLDVGETQQFTASLVDSSGAEQTAEFEWGMDGDFGIVDAAGLFEALEAGRGFIYATTQNISGRAHVVVMKDVNNGAGPGVRKVGTKMILVPKDTLVLVENVIQYQAFLEDTLGNRTEIYPAWELVGREVGTIDESGLFTAESPGNGTIKATLEHYTATARARIATADDTAKANQTEFKMKKRDGGQVGNVKRIAESDVFRISGMPFPLNLLNGAEVTLPAGSLDEDVTIDVSIPSLADIKGDSTMTYPEAILNGISFDVYVNGEKVSPYVFDEPVQIVIPYKQEWLEDYGFAIEDLWVFFYTDSAGYNDDGLFNIYVDTTDNKIIVEVSHFSEIVIGDHKLAGTTDVLSQNKPSAYQLFANYPNPFNPETLIRFQVGGQGLQHFSIRIYNLLGQEIRVLANRDFAPGLHQVRWDGMDKHGQSVSSGVYLYRLEGENLSLCKRMVFMR